MTMTRRPCCCSKPIFLELKSILQSKTCPCRKDSLKVIFSTTFVAFLYTYFFHAVGYQFYKATMRNQYKQQRRIQGVGCGGCNPPTPPPFGKFSNLSGYPHLSLFHNRNNTMSYNINFGPIDHYKKTVAIPFLDSLIIQM